MKLTCRDCGKSFVFSEKEQAFFAQKKWKDPVRCPLCREKNKKLRRDPYYGWESVMYSWGSRRGHHTRVHYAPHTVGGFR